MALSRSFIACGKGADLVDTAVAAVTGSNLQSVAVARSHNQENVFCKTV